MGRFFDMDNKFFTFMSRVSDLIILNLLCILCCLPIVTAGASITAMFYVTLKMVRNEEAYIAKSFFKSFKQNLKQSIAIHLIMLVTAALLYFDLTISKSMSGLPGKALSVIFMMIMLLYVMVFIYIYPILSKFYNSVKNTFINAFLMAIRHLPYTLLMLVITVLPVAILYIPTVRVQTLMIMLFLLLGFATIAYINSHFFVKIFDNYIPKENTPAEPNAPEQGNDSQVSGS
nr:DUF624 domain-containing protein [uncultured Blautia sp.]